jgi:hypothetical protein
LTRRISSRMDNQCPIVPDIDYISRMREFAGTQRRGNSARERLGNVRQLIFPDRTAVGGYFHDLHPVRV